jgi:hypothetical protein
VPRKNTGRSSKRGAPKRAPLAVGGRKGSSGSGAPDAKLARIEQDLAAALDEGIASLKKLRDRVAELSLERTAPEPQGLLAMSALRGPTTRTSD